jgi:hypothetical protein
LSRLEIQCLNKGYIFTSPIESNLIYDCVINNKKIQCKTTGFIHRGLYKVGICKNGGMVNGKRTKIPYSKDDLFDIVIIEIIDFPNNFYVIPKLKLVEKGIFSSEGVPGLVQIAVPHKGYTGRSKYMWLLDYLNNWSYLTN